MEFFDPNGVGVQNGHIFGLPYTEKEADLIIIPVPWDLTASYGKGCAFAPERILEASTQLDYFDYHFPNAHETKVFMAPISQNWKALNDDLSAASLEYIDFLENGGDITKSEKHQTILKNINAAGDQLQKELDQIISKYQSQGKKTIILGGEHSVPETHILQLAQKHDSFSILQLDAHADLRIAYEGFEKSHASIFYNVLQQTQNINLTQVGIRDLCEQEFQLTQNDPRINTFSMPFINELKAKGKTWDYICNTIIDQLNDKVYLTIDIDGLETNYCPNTGTPVPGGYSFGEQDYLLNLLSQKRSIIGADLCEVGNDEWDANVGMRVLWKMCLLMK